MATSRNSRQFAKRFKILADAVKRNTLKAVKRAAIAADQTAVLKTPVDSGRLRSNWLVSIGVPRTEVVAFAEGKQGSTKSDATRSALEAGRSRILNYKLGKGGIFISNNVVYATLVDDGSSAQAPAGMTADAIRAAQRQLGDARLLGR